MRRTTGFAVGEIPTKERPPALLKTTARRNHRSKKPAVAFLSAFNDRGSGRGREKEMVVGGGVMSCRAVFVLLGGCEEVGDTRMRKRRDAHHHGQVLALPPVAASEGVGVGSVPFDGGGGCSVGPRLGAQSVYPMSKWSYML